MSYVEPIGVAILSSNKNTIILSRNRNFAPIVSKLGKKVGLTKLIKVKNELCESNRSIVTFLQKFFFPPLRRIFIKLGPLIDVKKIINTFNIIIVDNSKFQ